MPDETPITIEHKRIGQKKIVQNLTAKRLKIKGTDGYDLVLAPFEKERQLSEEQLKPFPALERLEMQNFVRILNEKDPVDFETQLKTLFWAAAISVGGLIFLANAFSKENPSINRWVWIGGGALFLIVMTLGAILLWRSRNTGEGELAQSVTRWTAQALSLLLILALGIGLPSLAFYFFGGGREVFGSQTSLAKLGRTLQHIFIFTASLLPALLYFLFDRQQLGTLRQRFEQQIFRLDPNIQSLVDVRAKYGRQIDEIYGRESTSGEGRLVRNTRWPILVATLVITLGWMLTLLPAGPGPEITQATQLIDFFVPQRTAVTFGFLGAYFFILNMVLHRYVRADLKPKAYSSITVRIFVVVILAWVMGLTFQGYPWELMLVFTIGVFPESGLTLIRESIRNQTGLAIIFRPFIPSRREKYPLTELEELDVYDRARLLDEGVTNIESLAHHDLIDLMLETRIPVPRLVDWIDQSILYLHLESDAGDKEPKQNGTNGHGTTSSLAPAELRSLRTWLRGNFVRTASDFIAAYKDGKGPLSDDLSADKQHQLRVLLETLKDDEWLSYVLHWRNSSDVLLEELDAS
ncbi:MAG: hypothetical protein ND895_14625, partial [Pyrinomonadaceae bacterium]|nr:hypothetical protein [Pyrinomonadaceae bacterium]